LSAANAAFATSTLVIRASGRMAVASPPHVFPSDEHDRES
jgi:hypothetical protein